MNDIAAAARGLVAVGFSGRRSAQAPLAELAAFGPGAILLFARNVGSGEELRELIAALRASSALPPLIAVDQEGGRVARIGAPAVAALPSAMAVAAGGDVERCERLGRLLGRDLARLGVSVDLAPVADCVAPGASSVIGTRSYGSDPAAVGRFAAAFARGLAAGGVAATLKHFPGHGATVLDSHVALPRLDATLGELRERELAPFAYALAHAPVDVVLLAHVIVEALDRERPASLAPRVVAMLRDELGFDGVACTDCLQMGALAALGPAEAGVAAVAAGVDLLLVSHSLEVGAEVAAALTDAVENGVLARPRFEQAVTRVRALRERFAQVRPAGGEVDEQAPWAAARAAVTVLRGDVRLQAGLPVSVVSFEAAAEAGVGEASAARPASLSAELRRRRWQSEVMRVALEPAADDLALLRSQLTALGRRNLILIVRRAQRHPAQRSAVAALVDDHPEAIVVSAAEPDDALLWEHARRVACLYGDDELMLRAAAEVLSGAAVPSGRLPVTLDDVCAD